MNARGCFHLVLLGRKARSRIPVTKRPAPSGTQPSVQSQVQGALQQSPCPPPSHCDLSSWVLLTTGMSYHCLSVESVGFMELALYGVSISLPPIPKVALRWGVHSARRPGETLPGDCPEPTGTEVHAGPGSCQRENSPVNHGSGHFSDSSFQKLEAEVLSSVVRQE